MVVRLFAYTLCLSCIGVGLYSSLVCINGILLGYTVANWPTAPARIASCDLETFMDEGSTTYRIDLSYRYTVDGVAYTSKGIHPAVNDGGGELRELYAKLEGAKSVLVRYNPDDPSEAYLFGGGYSKPLNEVFGAFTFLVFGTLFFLMVYCSHTGGSAYAERLAIVR